MNLILFTATGHAGMKRGCANFRGVAWVVAHDVAFHSRVCVRLESSRARNNISTYSNWSAVGEQVVVAAAERQAVRKIVGEIVGSLGMVVGGKVDAVSAASTTLLVEVVLGMLPPPALSSLPALPLIW